MRKNIILIGGGGHCKAVIDIVELLDYNILGILDSPNKIGEKVLSATIIGSDDDIEKYVDIAEFIIAVGYIKDSTIRYKLFEKVKQLGGKFATVISPTAYVSKYAKIGTGNIVMHHAVVNADAMVGDNCIINTFANIEHDATIGFNSHISTGAMVNGGCQIGENVFIGSQSTIAQNTVIANDSIISAGTFVNKDILIPGVYAGIPAKKICSL